MAIDEKMKAFVEKIAKRGCNRIYINRPKGFSCIDQMMKAKENPNAYTDRYRAEILSGQYLCDSCEASLILS